MFVTDRQMAREVCTSAGSAPERPFPPPPPPRESLGVWPRCDPQVCKLSKTSFFPLHSHQRQVKTHMSLTPMENLPCDSRSGLSRQACSREVARLSCLSTGRRHTRGHHAHRSTSGLQGQDPWLSLEAGGRRAPLLWQPAERGAAISWPCSAGWEQFQNFRHLETKQLQRQAGAPAVHPHPGTPTLSDQLLVKPGKQEAAERFLEFRPCFSVSTSNANPSQALQAGLLLLC